jgi:hypothetical protein
MPLAGICAGGYERSEFLLRLQILSDGVHRFEGTTPTRGHAESTACR